MQLCPSGQSAEVWQASWHLPAVHTSGELQSLLRVQVPPTSIFFASLQPTMRQAETTTKPRIRSDDADISFLLVGLRHREKRAVRNYHKAAVQPKPTECISKPRASATPAKKLRFSPGSPCPLTHDCTSSTKPQGPLAHEVRGDSSPLGCGRGWGDRDGRGRRGRGRNGLGLQGLLCLLERRDGIHVCHGGIENCPAV